MNIIKQSLAYLTIFLIIAISMKVEFEAYTHIFSNLKSAEYLELWPMAVALLSNIGKILILQSIVESESKSFIKNWGAYSAVFLLMLNSFIWSLSIVGAGLDAPQLEKVAIERKQQLNDKSEHKEKGINKKYESLRKALELSDQQSHANIKQQYQKEIDLYEKQLVHERENRNSLTGFYMGNRYKDIEKRLMEVKKNRSHDYREIQKKTDARFESLNRKMNTEHQNSLDAYDKELGNLDLSKLHKSGDDRIQDPIITSFLNIHNNVITGKLTYIELIAFIALLLALIFECLSFNLLKFIDELQRKRLALINKQSSKSLNNTISIIHNQKNVA